MSRGLLAIALLLAGARAAWATVELPVEFGELVAGSQLIVHGRVVDVRSQQIGARRSIETIVTVLVADAYKGQPGETVTFRVPGGEVGRYRRVMIGAPQFEAGQEIVVFLRGAAPAVPTVFGLNQGVFRVARTADARVLVMPAPVMASGRVAERVVRGDPARQPLALDAFAREVRTRVETRP